MESANDKLINKMHFEFTQDIEKLRWVPLSLTLVEYPEGDFIGKILALTSLLPFMIIVGFLTLILFRRDLHTIAFFAGILINDCINFILKHTICEARPIRRQNVYVEYGMPSTHAQFMWFFTAYIFLFVCIRLHYNTRTTTLENFWRLSTIIGSIIVAILVTYSRVYLLYHSNSQVLCGTLLGVILGITWFLITHTILTPFFPVIATWRISEYLLLRDTTLIPNMLWFEYTNARTEARARSRKLVSMKSQ